MELKEKVYSVMPHTFYISDQSSIFYDIGYSKVYLPVNLMARRTWLSAQRLPKLVILLILGSFIFKEITLIINLYSYRK